MATKARKTQSKKAPASVEVKKSGDVIKAFHAFIAKNVHDRYNTQLTKATQEKIVSYGPWLAAFVLLVLAPELLVLAKESRFISFSGFLETILFNQDSWVLLIVLLINCVLAFDALGELFNKTKRGWNRVYSALLINLAYVLYQLGAHLSNPAAPILSILGFGFCLFVVFDVKRYYK